MRHYLGELLQALEKSYPDGLKVSELREKFFSETDAIIHDAVRGQLIFFNTYDQGGSFLPESLIYLNVNGFGLLNQMKMKEAVDQLDRSINKFSDLSDKSSEELIYLTKAIIVFTIIVAAIPLNEKILQLININSPLGWIIGYFMCVSIATLMLYYFDKHYKKRT